MVSQVVFSQASSFTPRNIYLDDIPSTASYVINTDGTYYWSTRDDGYILLNGTDADILINNILLVLTAGGKIIFGNGVFELSDTLDFPNLSVFNFVGQGFDKESPSKSTVFKWIGAIDGIMFDFRDTAGRVILRDFAVDGNGVAGVTGMLWGGTTEPVQWGWFVENIFFDGFSLTTTALDLGSQGGQAEGFTFINIQGACMTKLKGMANNFYNFNGLLVTENSTTGQDFSFFGGGLGTTTGANVKIVESDSTVNLNFYGTYFENSQKGIIGFDSVNTGGVKLLFSGTKFATSNNTCLFDFTNINNYELTVIGGSTTSSYQPIYGDPTTPYHLVKIELLNAPFTYKNPNYGVVSITGAVNSVTVVHNTILTPTIISISPRQSGFNETWVSARNATTFTISFTNQPGGNTWYFDWEAYWYDPD